MLTDDLKNVARLLATGVVLMDAPEESGELVLMRTPEEMPIKAVEYCNVPRMAVLEQPKEPWRRGRPLR